MNPIVLEGLHVRYGRRTVIDQVSLSVEPGTVCALLGRNGTGKTSLLRCLLGVQRPQSGRAYLRGHDAWTERRQAMLGTGVVPEEPDAPPSMTVERLVQFSSRLYPSWDREAVARRLARGSIPMDVPFGRLSKGQKGLVGLALALGHAPEVLVLDDPTLGLDAVARRGLFEELVDALAERTRTVLITTHDLAGVEAIADRVVILEAGRLLVDEPLETLKQRHADDTPALEDIFLAVAGDVAGGAR